MKKQTLKVVSMLGLLVTLAVVSVSGASSGRIVARIPFDFTAGNKTFPAGAYDVSFTNMQGVLLIRSQDRRAAAMVHTQARQAKGAQEQTRLGFRRYGDQYFLAEVWTAGSDEGRELPRSRREREVAKGAAKHLARNASVPETVYIAAQ